ncbi:glyoxal oxidase N-terminus-domain-containing protein [Pseudomassariella vexata]|uniref:Glyoxal oxidase N-terminus-domain-containing protein n=1 Tax=Pseudomassariella vexata TaxID=1141098 RepID=A0A1Y2E583_9PEZI|nr:glyoxal oxidase N-terminus-domain-containing protein [Pseudomassariella vexata]ORY66597.1 glyoxal oxidase N-terminus-domain-containing protein [Pseudomassariella vexata]
MPSASASLLGLAVFTSTALANINFTWVQPSCRAEAEYTGCLAGQICRETTCEPIFTPSFDRVASVEKRTVTTDGTCGAAHSGTVCGNRPDGSCRSTYGRCGSSSAHCGTGCQSGNCISALSTRASTTPKISTKSKTSTRAITNDGTCGLQNNGAVCGDWPQGSCCSSYGYCGNSTAHCGAGCQSGPCVDVGAPSPGSGSTSTATSPATTTTGTEPSSSLTTDGSCGANYGGTVCGDWPQGSCCSMYGFCGNTTGHCGDGCQSGPCLNGATTPAPGPKPAPVNANPGTLKVVGDSGVPAMHAGLLPNGRVLFLDKVENYTQLKLSNGQYAYSSEYNPADNTVVPLAYKTNAFCAGGMFLADGRFVSLGGNAPLDWVDPTVGDGFDGIRYLERSSTDAKFNGQDWSEPGNKLSSARWYPSAQIMPDSTVFVASGSLNGLDPNNASNNNPTYEILDSKGVSSGKAIAMDILVKNQPYYMYPFMHLLPNGKLFVSVSKSSEIFDVASGSTVTTLADLPGQYRTYPNTGTSVLMPLSSTNGWTADVIICGGGAYQDITAPTDASCGRMKPLDAKPTWEMDAMPEGRCMVEGVNLPDGTILFVNGANQGAQGFGEATKPTLETLIYDPAAALGARWTTGATSTIARLYHSVALLLLDGTVMIAGSNPVEQPILKPSAQNPYVTEFRVEIYTPPYLANNAVRPSGITLSTPKVATGAASTFTISFTAPAGAKNVKVALYHGGFVTHSVHMGQRMLYLDNSGFKAGATAQTVTVKAPPNKNVAPPGPYVVYVVVDGVPGVGQFVQVS